MARKPATGFKLAEGGINVGPASADSGILAADNPIIGSVGDGAPGSDGGGGVINPAELSGPGSTLEGTGDGEGKRRRKRGPNKAKSKSAPLGVDAIKTTLIFAHIGLAGAFKVPELALTSEQAEAYAVATRDVMSFYDVGASEKAIAWANLLMAAGGIYYGKWAAYQERLAADKAARVRANGAGTVQNIIPRAAMGLQ